MRIEVPYRRRRYPTLTSLIDIIFLLLLFFMLSSTFSKFNEVEVMTAASGSGSSIKRPDLFISLSGEEWRINGEKAEGLEVHRILDTYSSERAVRAVLRVTGNVTSQRLVDAVGILNRTQIEVTLVR